MLALQSLLGSELQQDFDFELCHINLSNFKPKHYRADILCLHAAASWRKLPSVALLKLANLGTPLLYQEHHYCQGFVTHKVSNQRRFYSMLKLHYLLVDRVLSVSKSQASWMLKSGLIKANKLSCIGQAKPLEKFTSLPTSPYQTPFVIGAYGRFHSQKGFEVLINSMGRLSGQQVELRLAGGGELQSELSQMAQEQSNRDKIVFVGEVRDVPYFLAQCDCVIIPSRWEPFGLTCQESLAAGRAVIANNIDGLTEQILEISEEANGRVVLLDELSVESLVTAINTQITLAQECKEGTYGLSEQQRLKVAQAWPRVVKNWRELLFSVIQS